MLLDMDDRADISQLELHRHSHNWSDDHISEKLTVTKRRWVCAYIWFNNKIYANNMSSEKVVHAIMQSRFNAPNFQLYISNIYIYEIYSLHV